MEKLSFGASFQKSIDTLKRTECSEQQKLLLFSQIADCVLAEGNSLAKSKHKTSWLDVGGDSSKHDSPSVKATNNYYKHLSSAISVLLMFTEDYQNSSARTSAEENLYRIVRGCEYANIFRVQIDLYHEIKKNGNERSLRICLNLFACYAHLIKQRKLKSYALSLLPCILAIAKRRETILVETLSEFMKYFGKYLLICLNDNETMRLLETFINDTIAECAIKRRCSSQNAITVIENCRKRHQMARQALQKALDLLIKDQSQDTIVGVLGFLRLLLPIVLQSNNTNTFIQQQQQQQQQPPHNQHNKDYDLSKIVEILDVCLYLLTNQSHTIINASLEVINVVLMQHHASLENILIGQATSSYESHREILCKRKSLKNLVFHLSESKHNSRKSSAETIRNDGSGGKSKGMSSTEKKLMVVVGDDVVTEEECDPTNDCFIEEEDEDDDDDDDDDGRQRQRRRHQRRCGDNDDVDDGGSVGGGGVNEEDAESEEGFLAIPKDDKSLVLSDVEIDSLRSMDFETEVALSPKRDETVSLQSQKSTDSIGAFFSSILSQPSKDSVSKFFRSQKSLDSTPSTPSHRNVADSSSQRSPLRGEANKIYDGDDLSLESIGSRFSLGSHLSLQHNTSDAAAAAAAVKCDSVDAAHKGTTPSQRTKTVHKEESQSVTMLVQDVVEEIKNDFVILQAHPKEVIYIGTIFEQTMIDFIVRLIASKFLLTGHKEQLIPDNVARVSIKSLSLSVIAHCVRINPRILTISVSREPGSELENYVSTFHDMTLDDTQTSEELSNNELSSAGENKDNASMRLDEVLPLEIKDDHFGESTCKYLEFLSPLSKSADQLTIVQHVKGKDKEAMMATTDDEFAAAAGQRNKKLSKDLCNILSKSDIVERRRSSLPKVVVRMEEEEEEEEVHHQQQLVDCENAPLQYLHDVLLYATHCDPILRGNVCTLAGNFLTFALGTGDCNNLDEFFDVLNANDEHRRCLNLEKMLSIITQGLRDDIHTVVRQSLLAAELVYPVIAISPDAFAMESRSKLNHKQHSVDTLIDSILVVAEHKYWLVQCTFSDVISKMHLQHGTRIYAQLFEKYLLASLNDNDIRVRNAASKSLCRFIITQLDRHSAKAITDAAVAIDETTMLKQFVVQRVYCRDFPQPIRQLEDCVAPTIHSSTLLFDLLRVITNKSLEKAEKNHQFGLVRLIKELILEFNPMLFGPGWQEHNIIEVCLSFTNQNSITGNDLICQSDLIEICTSLVAGMVTTSKGKDTKYIDPLLMHVLKLINIFCHLFSGAKPLVVPKTYNRGDIFVGAKELALINSVGYFGNEPFYLKLHNLLKVSLNNYKISITKDSGDKMMALLKACLCSLNVIFDVKQLDAGQVQESVKLIEEVLGYLTTLINWCPLECVKCLSSLLKYLFARNFASKSCDYQYFIDGEYGADFFEKFHHIMTATATSDGHNNSGWNFGSYIKLFEPLVIQCLKLFTKSNSKIQSAILEMLCQLLEFKVNYSLLDSNNVFTDFIWKHLEAIESGCVRRSELLIGQIVRFLFHLSNQKDKKTVTVPKIINMVDNLLANSAIRECSMTALNELAYETFFNQKSHQDGTEFNEKELNTQKEVVFSMLIKFLDCIEIRKMICWILLANRKSQDGCVDEHELLAAMLTALKGPYLKVPNNFAEHLWMRMLFKAISKGVVIQSKNFDQILKMFFNTVDDDLDNAHKLSVMTIILENAILITDEVHLFTLIKLVQQSWDADAVGTVGHDDEATLFAKYLQKCVEHCAVGLKAHNDVANMMLLEFVAGLQRISKFKISVGLLKRELLSDVLLEDMWISMVQHCRRCNDATFTLCALIVQFLIEINSDVTVFFNLLSHSETPRPVRVVILRILSVRFNENATNWNGDEINFLLDNSFDLLVTFTEGCRMLLVLAAIQLHAPSIVTALDRWLSTNAITIRNNRSFLDVLAATHCCSIASTVRLILQYFLAHSSVVVRKRATTMLLRKLDELKTLSSEEIAIALPEAEYRCVAKVLYDSDIFETNPQDEETVKYLANIYGISDEIVGTKHGLIDEIDDRVIDEVWFLEQIHWLTSEKSQPGKRMGTTNIVQMLNEIKFESKLVKIILSSNFDTNLLHTCLQYAFTEMIKNFRNDCVQYNPHINYLKLQPMLKVALIALSKQYRDVSSLDAMIDFDPKLLASQFADEKFIQRMNILQQATVTLMTNLTLLEDTCLLYVDAKQIEKFIREQILKSELYEILARFATLSALMGAHTLQHTPSSGAGMWDTSMAGICISFDCCRHILEQPQVWAEINQPTKHAHSLKLLLHAIHDSLQRVQMERKFNYPKTMDDGGHLKKVIFVAHCIAAKDEYSLAVKYLQCRELRDILIEMAVSVLRTEPFYMIAVTPPEIIDRCDLQLVADGVTRQHFALPFDLLNDADVIAHFVKRINIFGFPSRRYFEEFFMSLLVLVNKENDADIVDAEEQFQIKSICLTAITELLLWCKQYPVIGNARSKFHLFPRAEKIKAETISIKKLHKVQLLIPGVNIFCCPNSERMLTPDSGNSLNGTVNFLSNQFELNYIWQKIEEPNTPVQDVAVRNEMMYLERSGIDLRSSVQLIYDVFSQQIEQNYMMILPHLVKLSELCETRDQFKWIRTTMLRLQTRIPMTDSINHQYIIFLLCKSHAVLVPTLNELQHLCTLIPVYLKSSYLFVRIATLNGLLCLLECCVKTNTTIGGLSEELNLVRNVIVNYIIRHGIIEESSASFSDQHMKLVWTLNFYLIETTSKFVADCNLLSNTIISSNNLLKRTTNLDQYLCILHGLERLVITKQTEKSLREKIDKLALDLVKLESDEFSLPALKLLVTCMYIGSSDQLENTEKSNGIVQDDMEVMLQSTEKINVLFARIKSSTAQAAPIYGNVLCEITRDLIPPNEILTKVIKELLTVTLPYSEVMAKIVFQVFRSVIDYSYLGLLQDWLICSMPNFVALNVNKAIWCLTIIFTSASINLHLVKTLPEVAGRRGWLLTSREEMYFCLAARDFYKGLAADVKGRFKDVFKDSEINIYQRMLNSL